MNSTILELAKKSIETNFPEFKVTEIAFVPYQGVDFRTVEVNRNYIFRFPRILAFSEKLKREIALFKQLKSRLSLKIPDFEFIGKIPDEEKIFVGYRKIPGTSLRPELFGQFSKNEKRGIAVQIADFLKVVHSFPIKEAMKLGIEKVDFRVRYAQFVTRSQSETFRARDEKVKKYIHDLIQPYLQDEANFEYMPTLIHADVNADHILLDPESKKLTGIIDFGDIEIGDPDYDLMHVYDDYGVEFVDLVLESCSQGDREMLMQKLEFFNKAEAVQMLFWGIDEEDEELFREGLEILQQAAG